MYLCSELKILLGSLAIGNFFVGSDCRNFQLLTMFGGVEFLSFLRELGVCNSIWIKDLRSFCPAQGRRS